MMILPFIRFGNRRLKSTKINSRKIHHFLLANEVKKWIKENPDIQFIFLCDYELIGQGVNGIDLIKDLNIIEQSILVTSRYSEEQIRLQCEKSNLKLLPKSMANYIPIKNEDYKGKNNIKNMANSYLTIDIISNPSNWGKHIHEAIYIEDDNYLRLGWKKAAAKKNVILHTFDCPEGFLSKNYPYDLTIPIFIR